MAVEALDLKSFDEIVSDQATVIQAQVPALSDLSIGSILRAIIEANAGVALWEEALISFVQSITRLATSTGINADTFVQDFGYARPPAVAASGEVTFSRFTPTQQAVVPVGQTVGVTSAPALSYTVILDTDNPTYNSTLGGYVITAGTPSVTVTVDCNRAGTVGNVGANAINIITSPINGVDTVTNALAFSNGQNAPSDAQLRTLFIQYLQSLERGTVNANLYAARSVQSNVEARLVEFESYAGDSMPAYFYIIVDDGTGDPPPLLLDAVYNAVYVYRACGVQFDIFPPIIVNATVTGDIVVDPQYDATQIATDCVNALETYLNLIPIGESLVYTRLIQIIYNVSPGIIDIQNLLLNGGTSDLIVTPKDAIKPTTVTINPV
jgi:uncharacterized phage protein gp47/JayE